VRENYILGHKVPLERTIVIPNALDASFFQPKKILDEYYKEEGKIRIVVLCRMCYKKGMDLLIQILPVICKKYENLEFLLAGDGSKVSLIKEIAKQYNF